MIRNIILAVSLLLNLVLAGALGLFVYQDEFLAYEKSLDAKAIKERGLSHE